MRHCHAAGALAGAASESDCGGGAWEPAGGAEGSAGPGWGSTACGFRSAGTGCSSGSSDAVVAAFGGSGCALLGGTCLRADFQADQGHPSWADAGCGDAASKSTQQASIILMPLPPSRNHTADADILLTFG